MTDSKYQNHCTINWGLKADTIKGWDEICIASIELFGLPGGRYITDMGPDKMIWSFCDPKDALLFKLKFSEVTV